MSKQFAEDLLDLYSKERLKREHFSTYDSVGIVLTKYLQANSSHIVESLEKMFDDIKQPNEKDVKFALELGRITGTKDISNPKIFDIILTKKLAKCSNEFKSLVMQHFCSRSADDFKKYLVHALDASSSLFATHTNAKYLLKRIIRSKVEITDSQALFFISALSKLKIANEGQYLVFLKLLDHLGKINKEGYKVFEEKFNELYSGEVHYIFTTPDVIVKILNSCSDADIKYKMAKRLLIPPFSNNKYIQKTLERKVPELQKLLNFK